MRTAYAITDGEDFVAWSFPGTPCTWPTREAAEWAAKGLTWHPKRYAGPFRVEEVVVDATPLGTVLAVTRLPVGS